MAIRFLTDIAGERFHVRAGQVVSSPPPELYAFVDGVRAEFVRDEESEDLIAVAPSAPEQAVRPSAKRRGKR